MFHFQRMSVGVELFLLPSCPAPSDVNDPVCCYDLVLVGGTREETACHGVHMLTGWLCGWQPGLYVLGLDTGADLSRETREVQLELLEGRQRAWRELVFLLSLLVSVGWRRWHRSVPLCPSIPCICYVMILLPPQLCKHRVTLCPWE